MCKVSSYELVSYIVNPFHLVEESPWPIVGSLGALFLAGGLVA